MDIESPIGVFDSGVGGVSVLRELVRRLPHEKFIYYGDCLNAPYGTKDEDSIRTLALHVADVLLSYEIKALVVACNTATSAAVSTLRERLTIPVVGMEPALKPASFMWHGGAILVLATPATLRQSKFQRLNALYGEHAVIRPCPGLMEFVERGELKSDDLMEYLRGVLSEYKGVRLDAVVLGCTHYVFLKKALRRLLPDVPLVDGNDGTARRLESLLSERGLLRREREGSVVFMTSGDENRYVPLMQRLLNVPSD
ncbi:MAG: glutamate racemase [Clostridia bacterium]|nr:glutamate racemase [Clostridia bacterium]